MAQSPSFGFWTRRRHKALDFTRTGIAQRVFCPLASIKEIEHHAYI